MPCLCLVVVPGRLVFFPERRKRGGICREGEIGGQRGVEENMVGI